MKFCIATIAKLNSYGLDTTNFRKSKKSKAIVQYDKLLKKNKDIEKDKNVLILEHNSPELTALLQTTDWKVIT